MTTTTFDGASNTNWDNVANWDAGVPDETLDAVIDADCIMDNDGLCKSLTINASKYLDCSGQDLEVRSGMTDVYGILSSSTGEMKFWSGSTTGYGLQVRNAGKFNGGSGVHYMGSIKSYNNASVICTLTSGITYFSGHWDANRTVQQGKVSNWDPNGGTVVIEAGADGGKFGAGTGGANCEFYNLIINMETGDVVSQYSDIMTIGGVFTISGGTFVAAKGTGLDASTFTVSGTTIIGADVDAGTSPTLITSGATCNFYPQMDGGKPADALPGLDQRVYGTTDLGTGVINCNGWRIYGPGYGSTTPFSKTSGEINIYGYWDSNEYCTTNNSAHLDFGTTSILLSSSASGVLWNLHSIGGPVLTWTCSGMTTKLSAAGSTIRMYNRSGDISNGVASKIFEVSGNMIIEKGTWITRLDGVNEDVCGLKATNLWIKPDGTLDADTGEDSGVVTRNGCDHTFGTFTIGPESPSTTPGGLYNATSGNTIITAEDGSLRGDRAIYWRYGNFNHNSGTIKFTKSQADMEEGADALWNVSGSRINLKFSPDNIANDFTVKSTRLNGWPWTTKVGGDLILTNAGGSDGFSGGGQEHLVTVSGSVIMQSGSAWGKVDYGASGTRHIYGGFFNNGGIIH